MVYDYLTENFKMGNGIAGFSVSDWRDIREIRINQYSNQYVSEALKGEFTGWFMDNIPAVFISSPTGSGKNFFIEQCIIPFVNICHGNILILSNRIALGRQEKKRLAKLYGREKEIEKYTDDGLELLTELGNISIYSYHNFL